MLGQISLVPGAAHIKIRKLGARQLHLGNVVEVFESQMPYMMSVSGQRLVSVFPINGLAVDIKPSPYNRTKDRISGMAHEA